MDEDYGGNLMVLEYALYWLRLPELCRERLSNFITCSPAKDVVRYAPRLQMETYPPESAEVLLSRTPTRCTLLLQQLDESISSKHPFGNAWPEHECSRGHQMTDGAIRQKELKQPSAWRSDFLSLAIRQGMRYYVAEILNSNPGLVNAKLGRPYLHYAASGSKPQLVLDLVAQQADVTKTFYECRENRTAVQTVTCLYSINKSKTTKEEFDSWYKAIEFLVRAGADVNSLWERARSISTESVPRRNHNNFSPLHCAVRTSGSPHHKLQLCKLLVDKRAKPDGVLEFLCGGQYMSDPKYCKDQSLFLDWVLVDLGIRATPEMMKRKSSYKGYPWENKKFNPKSGAQKRRKIKHQKPREAMVLGDNRFIDPRFMGKHKYFDL